MPLTQRQADALAHIVEHCRAAVELATGLAADDLRRDRRSRFAFIYCVGVTGEAAGRLGPQVHAASPQVPWRLVTGMRHRLVHDYDHVNLDVLWSVVTRDVPALLTQVEAMRQAEDIR